MGRLGQISVTTTLGTQIDLFVWAREPERENKRIPEINAAGRGIAVERDGAGAHPGVTATTGIARLVCC